MAELADAADSKSADRKVVGVRPPLPAPTKSYIESAAQDGQLIFAWWLLWQLLLTALHALDGHFSKWHPEPSNHPEHSQ
jgi:hypothetical protein